MINFKHEIQIKENEDRSRKLLVKYISIFLGVLACVLIFFLGLLYKNYLSTRELNKVLNQNNYELIDANQKIQKAMKVKSDFLNTISHELRTPLNAIKGVSHLLQSSNLGMDHLKQIGILNFSSDYLLNFINNVIDFKILQEKDSILKKELVDPKVLIENIVSSYSISKIKNDNSIIYNIDENIPRYILTDSLKISQIFINLIDNALKFTQSGVIEINLRIISKNEKNVRINFEVKDNGIGISEKHHKFLFESFYQGPSETHRNYGGSGLGLSIVKNILDLYNSKIILESVKDVGTSFSFSIDFKIGEVILETKQTTVLNGKFDDIRVLLVEDNVVNQFITKKILNKNGLKCDVANDGIKAISMARENSYHVILMDIMMPLMDGFEATKKIREFDKSAYIIALTAISEKMIKDKFKNSSFQKVLSKPVPPKDLCEAIVNSVNVHSM